jgi:hypothetical protein
MSFDIPAVDSPGADHNVSILRLCNIKEFSHFLDRCGQIRVREEDILATGREHTITDSKSFPLVLRILNESQPLDLGLPDDSGSVVGGTIVYNDQLIR